MAEYWMPMGGHRPAEAAAALGVPPSTLRLYSVRFARLLSESAAAPVERGGGKPGYRLYTERDLALLREGKELLAAGRTYDEALRELRRRWAPRPARAERGGQSRARAQSEPASGVGSDVGEGEGVGELAPREEWREGSPSTWAPAPEAPAVREPEWAMLIGQLLATLGSSQAVSEEWRRIVEERNAEIAALRDRLQRFEEERRRPWWERLFGGRG